LILPPDKTATSSAVAPLPAEIEFLLSTTAIRQRCEHILNAVEAGQSNFFTIDRQQLDACAAQVVETTLRHYPNLEIPYHSRWRHFEAAGVDRYPIFRMNFEIDSAARPAPGAQERARAEIDLAVVSVLLDAGAGADWRYAEPPFPNAAPADNPNQRVPLQRSEGLGVASFHMFMSGAFSSNPRNPMQADAQGLAELTESRLARGFQVRRGNPLIGVAGRLALLQRLAKAMKAQPELFGSSPRPGGLFDTLTHGGARLVISAEEILQIILRAMASIWPVENRLLGHALGDCWPHRLAGGTGASAGWVPIHKLSQWLTYSLLEPFERAGVTVTDLDALTALAEYRNGGLLLDMNVIGWREPAAAAAEYVPADEAVIEWRALTIALMAPLAQLIRQQLGGNALRLPLAKILEGGTWAAGRALAQQRRGGLPPINIASDGTVF
jgi:Protein of unknown function (DUF1688)